MATCRDLNQYYDLLLAGRTGQGKSTLGNKLLQLKEYPGQTKVIKLYSKGKKPIVLDINKANHKNITTIKEREEHFEQFNTADNAAEKEVSITKELEMAVNKITQVRVVDTPGFADSSTFSNGDGDLFQANLQIFRLLLQQQHMLENKLQVRRVVYFLPQRGVLETHDAELQLELKVMHHFFGDDIFNCMVLIATNQTPFQAFRLGEQHFTQIRDVFTKAMELALPKSFLKCPPIVYIGIDDDAADVLKKIKNAEVLEEKVFLPKFCEICARCGSRCGSHVGDDSKDLKPQESESEKNQKTVPDPSCLCHPCFIQRSSKAEKIIGTIVHIATLGIPLAYESLTGNETWATITTSDERCPICYHLPGTTGCSKVDTTVDIKLHETKCSVLVKHSESL